MGTKCITYIELIVYSAIQEHKNFMVLTELVILQPQRFANGQIMVGYNARSASQLLFVLLSNLCLFSDFTQCCFWNL